MAFSKKQNLFINYLLNKIGFKQEQLINKYKMKLEAIYGKYYQEWRTQTYKNGYVRDYYEYRYTNSECIEELLKEIEIKKNLNSITLKEINKKSKISATDLSSFDFCPASYSIMKSFEIEHPTNEDKRNIGINLHETLRLVDKQIPKQFEQSDFADYNVIENSSIKKIKNCELIFSGHSTVKSFFENKEMNYIGQPDYIFKDPKGQYFAVEEKFKYLNNYISNDIYDAGEVEKNRKRVLKSFFSNHIVQLSSYVKYINEYDLKYGVLIYWFYDFNDAKPYVHNVSIKVVQKDANSTLLEKTKSSLVAFIENKTIDFSNKVNPNKCGACVVNKYCAHKTNEKKTLTFPYNCHDLKLKFVPFPEELKKSKPKIVINEEE